MIRPLISTFILARTAFSKPAFRFCSSGEGQRGEGQKMKDLDRAQNFYRNSIRKININDKGRGKFTQHHLIRLAKLTQKPSQLPLLFEGYYNYLGHLTPISSRTVDRMLSKALSFEGESQDSVIDIFQNHIYLSYFPSYEVTLTLINKVEKDEDTFKKLLQIFLESPLIKFNQEIVDKLLQVVKNGSTSHGIMSSAVKVLIQRSAFNVIDNEISSRQLLKTICEGIKNRFDQEQKCHFGGNKYVGQFIDLVKEKQEETDDFYSDMAFFSLAFADKDIFYEYLVKIKDQNRAESILHNLRLFSPSPFKMMTSFIESQEPSGHIRSVLEALKPAQQQGQVQAQAEKGE